MKHLYSLFHRFGFRRLARNFQTSIVNEFENGISYYINLENEALVKVECAGVNYADLLMLSGKYHQKPKIPYTPGFELAGVVESVGKNFKNLKEGDRILCLKNSGTGAFAQYCIVYEDLDLIVKLPYSINFDIAASVGLAYGSAYLGLQNLAIQQKGNSFLILTSFGTIGLAAIDLVQNVFEGIVFGASDTEEKLEYLRSANILSTFNFTNNKLIKNIQTKTFNKGVDFVIDTVGGDVFNQGLKCLKNNGHILSLSFSSGIIPNVDLLELHKHNATVTGVWLGGYEPSKILNTIDTVFDMFANGYLQGLKINHFSLENIQECINTMRKPNFFGKAVINMH